MWPLQWSLMSLYYLFWSQKGDAVIYYRSKLRQKVRWFPCQILHLNRARNVHYVVKMPHGAYPARFWLPFTSFPPSYASYARQHVREERGWHPYMSKLSCLTPEQQHSQAFFKTQFLKNTHEKPYKSKTDLLNSMNMVLKTFKGNSRDACLLSPKIKQCWSVFPFTQLSLQ